jgi:predicted lipid-binding transport protein (Tim44 family)
MENFLDLPTLIAIAVAVFVLFRLRSVLGTRTGNERPPVDRSRSSRTEKGAETAEETVVPLRPRAAQPDLDDERRARKVEAEIEQAAAGNADLAAGLRAVVEADATFAPKGFLEGAKQAYEMIVTAFAAGDRPMLRDLLDKPIYDSFQRAIAEREAAGQKVDFTFVGLPKVAIVDAEFDKKDVTVTVDFHAEVVSATRDKDGNLVEGNADQVQTIADEWTFARNPRSRDPNWKVVATSQLN